MIEITQVHFVSETLPSCDTDGRELQCVTILFSLWLCPETSWNIHLWNQCVQSWCFFFFLSPIWANNYSKTDKSLIFKISWPFCLLGLLNLRQQCCLTGDLFCNLVSLESRLRLLEYFHNRETNFSHVGNAFHPIRNQLLKWISQFATRSR